jgi:hypothetical protein
MREGYGVCPVCNGAKEVLLTADELKYSWNKGRTHRNCTNCGGQTMYGSPSGEVPLRKDNNEPCVHEYTGRNAGRCYTIYTCKHCNHSYDIDSGD